MSTIDKSINFFFPYLEEETRVTFFGGEPLLAFDAIKYTINLLEKRSEEAGGSEIKKFIYNLTTNGSLVTDEMVDLFDRYGFELMLSFDGIGQDDSRQRGTHDKLADLVLQIRNHPRIDFSVNSVFTPETVSYLAESISYILDLGVKEVLLSLSPFQPWGESALQELEIQLDRLVSYLLDYYREHTEVPVPIFREDAVAAGNGFLCAAGSNRISITPDERVWGCYLLHDYMKNNAKASDFKAYSLGTLDEFIAGHAAIYPKILENYRDLRQDRFFTEETFCFLCEDVKHCRTCPINGAYSTGMIGKLPLWICTLNRMERRAGEKFQSQLKKYKKREY